MNLWNAERLEQRVEALEQRLVALESVLARQSTAAILLRLEGKIDKMAHTLDETLAAVTAEGTKTDSIIALLNGIEQQLKDALAGTTLSPETQAKVDAIFDAATASSAKIDAAITAGTPAPTAP